MAIDEFTAKAYQKLVDSKHHYDNLSWLIGGATLAFAGGLIAFMPSIKSASYPIQVVERLVVAIFVWLILYLWHAMYQRNRIWAEAANEAMRDIERHYGIRGAGIAFMEASLTGRVTLKNTNEKGQPIADPFVEELKAKSMHFQVPRLAKLAGFVALAACFVP